MLLHSILVNLILNPHQLNNRVPAKYRMCPDEIICPLSTLVGVVIKGSARLVGVTGWILIRLAPDIPQLINAVREAIVDFLNLRRRPIDGAKEPHSYAHARRLRLV